MSIIHWILYEDYRKRRRMIYGRFFEDLGRKISDVANDIGKKTEDTIEIQKLKSDMRTLRRANDRDLMDMGRMVYDKFVQGDFRP